MPNILRPELNTFGLYIGTLYLIVFRSMELLLIVFIPVWMKPAIMTI